MRQAAATRKSSGIMAVEWPKIKRRVKSVVWTGLALWILLTISFVFLYPVFYMASTSIMSIPDLIEPSIKWLPLEPTFEHYRNALEGMRYWLSLRNSAVIALGAAVGHVLSAAMVGYGFARVKFPGREFLFGLALFTLLIPPQTTIVPSFMLYRNFGWIDTYLPFLVPSFLGQGLRGALYIFIFRQFFKGLPWELEDAAKIDGAGSLRVFASIMLPLAKPAILVVFLFSLVWHWNDYFEPMIYINSFSKFTLPLKLGDLRRQMEQVFGSMSVAQMMNEPLRMAASFLVILPPLLLYAVAHRWFVESVDRTGLVE